MQANKQAKHYPIMRFLALVRQSLYSMLFTVSLTAGGRMAFLFFEEHTV
jgi:hypothetical protein